MRAPSFVVPLILTALATSGCHREGDRTSQLAATLRQIVAGPAVLPVPAAVWKDVSKFSNNARARPHG